jgi:hypothetical protein
MGIIVCEKHGDQGFYEVCGHIDEEYKRNIYHKYRRFNLSVLGGPLVCDECWRIYNLDRFQDFSKMTEEKFFDLDEGMAKQFEDEWDKVYNLIDRRCWCVQCVAEIQVRQERKNNEPDPFRVFENTLTSNHQNEVKKIENRLIDELGIQKYSFSYEHFETPDCSSKHIDSPALFVNFGAFTYPMTISIHAVISEMQQNKIIEQINKTFESVACNQVKIEFYAEDIWTASKACDKTIHYKSSRGSLLKEVYLNC